MTSSHSEYLQAVTKAEVFDLLARVGDRSKILIIEKPLISIFDLNFKFSQLEAAGVVRIVEWTEDWSEIGCDPESTALVYVIRSLSKETLPLFTLLAESIKKKRPVKSCSRHLVFSPFVCELGLNRLKALGVDPAVDCAGVTAVSSLLTASLEEDVISLQLGEEVFSDYHCRGDPSLLVHVAHLIRSLQREFGLGLGHDEIQIGDRKIRKINAIGSGAKFVADLFLRMTEGGANGVGDKQNTWGAGDTGEEGTTTGFSRIGGIESIASLLLAGNACGGAGGNGGDRSSASAAGSSVALPKLTPSDAIDSVVLIDRRTDLYSVMCSQFTYESLIDEEFGIVNAKVKFTPTTADDTPTSTLGGQPVSMQLSKASDPLYGEIRDVSVSVIGQLLSKKANYIAQCYKEKDSLKSISEIKNFMDQFKLIQAQHSSLTNHVSLATSVSTLTRDPQYAWTLKVEDQIMAMSKPIGKILSKIESMTRRPGGVFTLERILRLLCLASLVYGPKAITNAGVEKVLKSIVNAFGFGAVRVIHHLEQCGLLKFHNPAEASGVMSELMSSGSKWPKIREEFKLISDSGEELAEPYSGYVPLSVRLVQLLNASWKASAAKLALLRGPALEIAQECPIATGGNANVSIIAVVFIGGVTYGEIAALCRLSTIEGGRRKFLIITTGVTSYGKVLRSM